VAAISAIVTTFDRPEHLRRCIASLEVQTLAPEDVVIADDGSAPAHVRVIEALIARSPLTIRHARQERDGYRIAASRNNAVRRSAGDLLFFTDADVVLFPNVLECHAAAAEGGRWVTGSAVQLTAEESERASEELIREKRLGELWPPPGDPRLALLRGAHGRFRRKALLARLWPTEHRCRRVHLLGYQATVPREAFARVNGFDEGFRGWGREDIDLGLRLQLAGVRGRGVHAASRALHLFHRRPPVSEGNTRYYERRRRGSYRCEDGLSH